MKIGQAPAQAQSVAENNSKYITGHDPATSAILNTALDVLAASPDLAKTLTAIITTLGKAAEDAANVKRLTKSLPHLEEYDPDLSSSHRLVFDWMKSLDEFALQLLITELQSRDNFKRWLEKRHDERERKRA
ncbi:MAG: hypothetical protein OEV73_00010 [Desulfobulbaceae bacterium]|nr:hypothetical protein [Desulfobulbaceae bacterium]